MCSNVCVRELDLLDHLTSLDEERLGHGETQSLGCLKFDHEYKFRGLLNSEVPDFGVAAALADDAMRHYGPGDRLPNAATMRQPGDHPQTRK